MDDKPSVSDEEWAAFVAAAREQGLGTEAQDRALRRAKPPKPPKRPKRPGAFRTRTRPTPRLKAILGIGLAAALALVAVRPQLFTALLPETVTAALPSSWTDHPEDTTPLPAETTRPTAAPSPVDPDRPTLAEPFRGSPALRWADGAAGIELPPAKATGWMSKERVEAALKQSKEFLVATNLDPAVLAGARPDAALKLLDPKHRDFHRELERGLVAPTEENDPLRLFSRFAPSEVRLVGTVVKTRGRMSVEKGTGDAADAVLVRADYTFVYPLVRSTPGADEVARTVLRRELVFAFYPAGYDVTRGRLVLHAFPYNVGNSSCGATDGFFHPSFPADRRSAPRPTATGEAVDPYDRSRPLDDFPHGCGTVTRS
ncbi:hypothetical protein [Streptomyces sp. NPDC053541]|uniref:hypothetical protein n=1 Tax=Streptomyces sp. NPDC053541 TaxID=3365709 RepID=UPI0037D8B142